MNTPNTLPKEFNQETSANSHGPNTESPPLTPVALALRQLPVKLPTGETLSVEQLRSLDPEKALNAIPSPEARSAVRLLLIGLDFAEPGNEPDWVYKAMCHFVESLIPNKGNGAATLEYRVGYFMGAYEAWIADPAIRAQLGALGEFLAQLFPLARVLASQWKPEENAPFFTGQLHGGQNFASILQISQRPKICAAIAFEWRRVASFKSTGQLHTWLLSSRTIAARTDSRETRKVCTLIGLRYPIPSSVAESTACSPLVLRYPPGPKQKS